MITFILISVLFYSLIYYISYDKEVALLYSIFFGSVISMMIVMVLSNTIDGHKEITTQRIELDSMDTSTTCLIIDLSKNKNEAIYKEKKSELLKEVDLKKTSISYVEEEKPFLIKQVTKYPISYLINWFVIHGNDEKYIFYLNNYSIKFKN